MVRHALVIVAMLGSTVLWFGCHGVSEGDAKLRCDQEQKAKADLYTQEAYDECVKCYEECGDDCVATASSPYTYACPD